MGDFDAGWHLVDPAPPRVATEPPESPPPAYDHRHCPCGCGAHMGCFIYGDDMPDQEDLVPLALVGHWMNDASLAFDPESLVARQLLPAARSTVEFLARHNASMRGSQRFKDAMDAYEYDSLSAAKAQLEKERDALRDLLSAFVRSAYGTTTFPDGSKMTWVDATLVKRAERVLTA